MVAGRTIVLRSAWIRFGLLPFLALLAIASVSFAQYPPGPQIRKDGTALLIEDYASLPLSNPTRGSQHWQEIDYTKELGRVNSVRSEPANAPLSASRFFVIDQSRTLYILDKATKKFTMYINYPEVFPKFQSDSGITGGLISIIFDPEYAKNGKFYTIHTEAPDLEGSPAPTNAHMPSLDLTGYTTTPTVKPPAGDTIIESVLIEWTDTNVRNSTFEGTARELLRVAYVRSHPMDDMIFNPLAKPGSSDYRNLYIGVGDGASGETTGPQHFLPQMLNNLMGKIIRITPDLNLRPKDMLSANGRYRIPSTGPDPNPFLNVSIARPEIFAYGLRHPHRMNWDVPSKTLVFNDIGDRYWEAVEILKKGANYGYAEREGNEQFFVDANGKTTSLMSPPVPFPDRDLLHVDGIDEPVVPIYPAAIYSHREGDSIGSGFVYRGKLMPQMRGKYIFNDMTTGRIFYADLNELLATHGERNHQAQIHEIQIVYKSPDAPPDSKPVNQRVYSILAENFARKGGKLLPDHVLPGGGLATSGWTDPEHKHPKTDPEGVVYGGGRADVRVVMAGDGELYMLSKSDGMIRKFTAVVTPPPSAK
jgi:hypothetical protein